MLNRIREAKRNEHGFNLIELLIVIVILGILAAIVVFSVQGVTDRGAVSACKADVKTVAVAGEAYFAQNNAYAANMAALKPTFLHSVPTDVQYTATATGFTAIGLAPCAGFS
jgi:prepilin-type N-terminal cleavage/methylation domain-containing protein